MRRSGSCRSVGQRLSLEAELLLALPQSGWRRLHPVQHAVEIAERPAIVDTASLQREYERIGYVNHIASTAGIISFENGSGAACWRPNLRRTAERFGVGLMSSPQSRTWLLGYLRGSASGYRRGTVSLRRVTTSALLAISHGVSGDVCRSVLLPHALRLGSRPRVSDRHVAPTPAGVSMFARLAASAVALRAEAGQSGVGRAL